MVQIFGNVPNSDYFPKNSPIFAILDGQMGLERDLLVDFWVLPLTFAKEVFWFEHSLYEKSPNLPQKKSDSLWISHKIGLNFTNLHLNIKVGGLLETLSWQQKRELDLAMI